MDVVSRALEIQKAISETDTKYERIHKLIRSSESLTNVDSEMINGFVREYSSLVTRIDSVLYGNMAKETLGGCRMSGAAALEKELTDQRYIINKFLDKVRHEQTKRMRLGLKDYNRKLLTKQTQYSCSSFAQKTCVDKAFVLHGISI